MRPLRNSLRRFRSLLRAGDVALSRRPFARRGGFSLFKFTCIAALGFSLPAFCVRKSALPGITPIQAELMADLNARLLKAGAPVYARVTVDWTGTDCVLRKGAVLEAHVVSVAPYNRSTKLSELDLAFTQAQCDAPKMAAFELLLAALAAPPRDSDLGILSDPVPLNTLGRNGLATLGTMQLSANVDLKLGLDQSSYDFHALPPMHMGEVSGIRGLKLDVGSGSENGTVLTVKGHNVELERHTLLLLVPAVGTYPRSASGSETAKPASAAAPVSATATVPQPAAVPPAVVPADLTANDVDLCDTAHCIVNLTPGDETDARKPEVSFSAPQLGYAFRPRQELKAFDHDETLAWLGPKQLLVAFNPHELITRHALGPSESTQRVIRATLLDTNMRRVMRTVDWELPDNAEYLWPLAESRVLVHVGSELRVYGEGLQIIHRIVLDGPLAFVRVTPDGNFIVVGQIHERYSPELRAQLRESLQAEPEEDVAVTILNRDFETIAKSDARSNLLPPTLLNEGQARLQALPKRRYSITLLAWDSQTSVLASFGSRCTPQLSSLAPDLLFLATCNLQNGLLEYRVLNSNGRLMLKGFSSPDDLVHTAKGIENPGTFVVQSIRSSVVAPGTPFTASSLEAVEFGVYRAADRKRLLGVTFNSPTSSLDGFALTADGSKLAVLTRDQVAIYLVDRE